ncbi:MAG: alpha-amylase, partial [Verrucomicrobiae bacterium]|nr:alpha-amylase [Verrucomicrobiae bacterium]
MRNGKSAVVAVMAVAAGLARAEAPKDLASLEARPSPEWLTRGVMYQVWLRGFTPEGTLKAASARL